MVRLKLNWLLLDEVKEFQNLGCKITTDGRNKQNIINKVKQ